jgi:HJR/Mrr/RecB family endonuclease
MFRGTDLCSVIGGIFIWICISIYLASVLLQLMGIDRPSSGQAIGASVIVSIFLYGIFYAISSISQILKKWKSCPHGILGGEVQGRCKACADAKKVAEDKYRIQSEREEKKRTIQSSANELRNSELARLARVILPNLDELRKLTSQSFEDEIATMFKRLGYTVKQTPYSGDAGKDAIMWKEGEKYLLECKRYASDKQSGRPELQKFHSAIISEGAKKGFFVTTGGFSSTAVKFAKGAKIEIIHGDGLVRYLLDSKPEMSDNDSYYSKCLQCGELVQHRLRSPETVLCRNKHPVEPTLNLNKILGFDPEVPRCHKCSAPMRLINGRRGKFWGCTRYPVCRSTKPWKLR